jgi:LysM repeat protein
MKKWMNWMIVLLAVAIVLSGLTLVFALGNETNSQENNSLTKMEGPKVTSDPSELYESKVPYKIQSGDSLWKLTANYSGSLGRQDLILQIMAYNELTDASKLQIHQVIYLPGCLSLVD